MSGTGKTRIIAFAIDPGTDINRELVDSTLRRFTSEEPTLSVNMHRETGQVIVAGMSEQQLERIATRLSFELHVKAAIGELRVIYKEVFMHPADGEGKFVRQSGRRGHYAHAKIRLIPGESGSGYVFADTTFRGSIPRRFIAPIEQGIREALIRHSVAGYAVDDTSDVRIEIYDGSYHDVDSSEMAFKIAGAMAFEDARAKASPMLHEPIMRMDVVVPSDQSGDAMRDLSNRRATIESIEALGEACVIKARVPLSTIIGYEAELRSRTQERWTCSIQFDRYEPCNVRPEIDDDGVSPVRVPRSPRPNRHDSAVAVPEPEDDGTEH